MSANASEGASAPLVTLYMGEGAEAEVARRWPDEPRAELTETAPRPAGRVYLYNCLQRLGRGKALGLLQFAASFLARDGELHVVVPSFDFVVDELARGHECPAWPFLVHGPQDDEHGYFLSAWDIPSLRSYLNQVGCVVVQAKALPASMRLYGLQGEEEEAIVKYNHVVGVKYGADTE